MTACKNDITAERGREVLSYDPETGAFRWRQSASYRMKPGSIAGTVNSKGYRKIFIDRRAYRAHRLAWLYVHGTWPTEHIDHINRVKDDNRIANFRDATLSENMHNRPKLATNSSGFKGVTFDQRKGKWAASITTDGLAVSLGYYGSAEEASAAYLGAARLYNKLLQNNCALLAIAEQGAKHQLETQTLGN